VSVALWIIFGVGVTHAQRYFFIRLGWLELKLPNLIPRVLISSTLASIVIYLCLLGMDHVLGFGEENHDQLTVSNVLLGVISMGILVLFWNAIYFTFHFFQKSRKQEVSNLSLTASNRESELQNLRSQLNPHFLFNSLKFLVLLAVFYMTSAFIFRYAPAIHDKWRFFSTGARLAGLLITISFYGFIFYLENFASYNKLYGSIGTIIALMLWLYLTSVIVLVCFEVNVSFDLAEEKQRARDNLKKMLNADAGGKSKVMGKAKPKD
jgi:uncharacterized BrkB/YihY/UPF0761 family membrane protein